jgi:hypothetical protein
MPSSESRCRALKCRPHAIDFVPVAERGRSARLSPASILRPEPPKRFPGFGRSLTAPARGAVVALHDGEPDHEAFRGIPSIRYALTAAAAEAVRRAVAERTSANAGGGRVLPAGRSVVMFDGPVRPRAGWQLAGGFRL